MIFVCPVANPGGSAFQLVARVRVSRVFRKQVLTCSNSLVSAKPHFGKPRRSGAPLQRRGAAQLGSLRSYNILPKRDRLDRGLHLSRCG